jgi:hypothetical protein
MYFESAIFNRFDLSASNGEHCGEYRVVYHKNYGTRLFLIFEAQYPNPEALFDSFSAEDVHDRHILFVTEIRERQWERIRSINLFMQRKIQSYGESFSWTYTVLLNDNTIGNPLKNTSVSGL